jgi:hypothetical protein
VKDSPFNMDRQEAKDILRWWYRAGRGAENLTHPRMAEALAAVARDPELAQWFKAHRTLDEAVHRGFLQIAVPGNLRERILTCPKITGLVAWWQQASNGAGSESAKSEPV